MASRLTSGPAREACPNIATVSGVSASVATACAARNPRTRVIRSCRHHISHSTPPKLSQKPGARTDKGSNASTAHTASASSCLVGAGRREQVAAASTATISTVRTVGSANPATAAYSSAASTPTREPATWLGQRRDSGAQNRQPCAVSQPAAKDTMVTCSPEMAIR